MFSNNSSISHKMSVDDSYLLLPAQVVLSLAITVSPVYSPSADDSFEITQSLMIFIIVEDLQSFKFVPLKFT